MKWFVYIVAVLAVGFLSFVCMAQAKTIAQQKALIRELSKPSAAVQHRCKADDDEDDDDDDPSINPNRPVMWRASL